MSYTWDRRIRSRFHNNSDMTLSEVPNFYFPRVSLPQCHFFFLRVKFAGDLFKFTYVSLNT